MYSCNMCTQYTSRQCDCVSMFESSEEKTNTFMHSFLVSFFQSFSHFNVFSFAATSTSSRRITCWKCSSSLDISSHHRKEKAHLVFIYLINAVHNSRFISNVCTHTCMLCKDTKANTRFEMCVYIIFVVNAKSAYISCDTRWHKVNDKKA